MRWGVSLAEVMLAVGLLGIILVSVIGLFQSLLSSSSKSTDLSVATVMAQERLNELVADQPNHFKVYAMDFPPQVLGQTVYAHDSQSPTQFYHQASTELLRDEPGFGRTYYLEVQVFWNTSDPNVVSKNRLGQGQQSVKMGRVVYLPNS
jgi:type II secretory pathway pseudopilin PulG